MPPSGVDYASEFLNGYAPEYVGTFSCELIELCNLYSAVFLLFLHLLSVRTAV